MKNNALSQREPGDAHKVHSNGQLLQEQVSPPKNNNRRSFSKLDLVPVEEEVKTCNKQNEDVLSLLTQLYAHDPIAVKKIETKRVNPDFTSQFRNDLEFFIPQLCSFYALGDYEKPQDILNLIVMASGSSFFFSHRVWFFFQSLIINLEEEDSRELYRKSRLALKGIKDACQKSKERLYLANSVDLIDLIHQFKLLQFYPQLSEVQITDQPQQKHKKVMRDTTFVNLFQKIERRESSSEYSKNAMLKYKNQEIDATEKVQSRIQKVKKVIDNYIENNSQRITKNQGGAQLQLSINKSFGTKEELKESPSPQLEKEEEEEDIVITAQDIILEPFIRDDDRTFKETMVNVLPLDENNQTKKYHDISNELIHTPNREEYLREELKKVNKMLPAAVYVPFVNKAFRPEELLLLKPEKPIGKFNKLKNILSVNDQKQYENYRSSSWDSSHLKTEGELDDPFENTHKTAVVKNPYQEYKKQQKKKKIDKNSLALLGRNDEALLGNEESDKRKTYKFSFKQSRDQGKNKSEREKQELKDRVNKLLDKKASNPLIIQNLRRSDSLFNKIKVNDNYFSRQTNNLAPISEETEGNESNQRELDQDPNNQFFNNLEGVKENQTDETIKPNFLEKSDPRYSTPMASQMLKFQSFNNEDSQKFQAQKEYFVTPDNDNEIKEEDSINRSSKKYDTERRSMSMLEPNESEELQAFLKQRKQHKTLKNSINDEDRSTVMQQAFFEGRPINNVFLETSVEQDERVRRNSPFGNLKTWRLIKIIVKSNDDVRQEQFAMQLISQMDQIFKLKKINLWLKPYEILATGARCGLLEVVSDALSIDSIKKKMGQQAKLIDYFYKQFGEKKQKKFNKAKQNFCRSLAAYSLVTYILQVKDRHNGNIMVDIEGHILHIDFGFLLSNAPGKGVQLEKKAPFKLTMELVEVLGGLKSKKFREYRELMRLGFMALQEHADKIIKLVEMMFLSQPDLPCFIQGESLIKELKERILPGGHQMSEIEAARHIDQLIQVSYENWRTKIYDKFQYCCQGIV
ncbi:phosphatidylinositol 4-kinase [Stylonychia lemnae]|uniref:1-phosphatidylinositol 4-kinase n=1 Tax=Stylonychia lemnae TaxID=5949 RepID=A0A077ZPJ0_STYLE|nr:phosphatidylinositol 4-kinase [Stylonychia lemnae]|eukprot:CDW71897.1 phosphatidylinositol 4-kinase [Stylonychia lemnae]